jgi:hypothetical protein
MLAPWRDALSESHRYLRSTVIFADPKRIEDNGTKSGDIAIIARHERQAIGHSSRRQQPVYDRDRPDNAHAPPPVGDRIVDAEHATFRDLRPPLRDAAPPTDEPDYRRRREGNGGAG